MAGHWYDPFAQVEEALASRGIAVSAYVDSEICEVAAMIGANAIPGDGDAPEDADAAALALLATGSTAPGDVTFGR